MVAPQKACPMKSALRIAAWITAGLLAFHILQSAKKANTAVTDAWSIPKQERAK